MGEKLPVIPRNPEAQGRTEIESFRDLFTYLSEESAEKRKQQEKLKDNNDKSDWQ